MIVNEIHVAIENMKTILFVTFTSLGLSAHAGILAGPVANPTNGHIYYLLSQNTWSNAEAEAVSLGGHLATVRNQAENAWIFQTFSSYGGEARILWIGLSDRDKKFHFTWSSASPLPTPRGRRANRTTPAGVKTLLPSIFIRFITSAGSGMISGTEISVPEGCR